MWRCVEYGGHLGYPRRFLGKVTEGTDVGLRRQILAGDKRRTKSRDAQEGTQQDYAPLGLPWLLPHYP